MLALAMEADLKADPLPRLDADAALPGRSTGGPRGSGMAYPETVRLVLKGIFDLEAGKHCERALLRVRSGGLVDLDLTRVREFHDAGVAVLARMLASRRDGTRFRVRGLQDRQVRLLRLLDVTLSADSELLESGPDHAPRAEPEAAG